MLFRSFDRLPSVGLVDKGAWLNRDSTISSDLFAVAYGGGKYYAVGAGSVLLSSTSAAIWQPETQKIDFSYSFAPVQAATAGDNVLVFAFTDEFKIGDEILQNEYYMSDNRSYITDIGYLIRIDTPLDFQILDGVQLEFVNYRDGSRIFANVVGTTPAGSQVISLDNIDEVQPGYSVYVGGIDVINACMVIDVVGTTVELDAATTADIPAGTKIIFDDLLGNQETLTTSTLTSEGSMTITFTSIGNITSGYYPRTAAIPIGTKLLTKLVSITSTESITEDILPGLNLDFQHRLTTAATIGDTVLYTSGASKIGLGSEIFNVTTESNTSDSASWDAVNPAGTTAYITVPVTGINGTIFRGMRVVGPGLPASTIIEEIEYVTIDDIESANITIVFNSSVVSAQEEVAVSFITPAVANQGTTVIAKTNTSVT